MKLKDLSRINRKAIRAAGPRYTPGTDADAPNIKVRTLEDAVNALALADGFRSNVEGRTKAVDKAIEHRRRSTQRLFRRATHTPIIVRNLITALLIAKDPADVAEQVRKLRYSTSKVLNRLDKALDDLYEERQTLGDADEDRDRRTELTSSTEELRSVRQAIQEVSAYVTGETGQLLADKSSLFLLGAWGTGKTHFLCDLARARLARQKPALLVLASMLDPKLPPLDAIARYTGLAKSGSDLLRELDALGSKTRSRTLLVVDGINESDRALWRRHLGSVADQIQNHPHVGLILSCRQPFDASIVTRLSRNRFVHVYHPGFADLEFDAQLEFFSYYKIPSPGIPLITPEFSRPLFLKLLCEAIRNLSKRSQRKKLREVASGQKGMTYVLEHFARALGRSIERDFELPPKSCWRLLKGQAWQQRSGIAGEMAGLSRDWVKTNVARSVIENQLELDPNTAHQLLQRLVAEGLLSEDVRWDDEGPVEAIQFPYQRFGDHLVARYLLDRHLVLDTENRLRRCFYSNRPLGKVFNLDRWGREFQAPGIAAAIMLEFPERVKRTSYSREVLHYLPKTRRLVSAVKDVFLDGLHWRSSDSFTKETDKLVGFFLQDVGETAQKETLEVLVSLAARPGHPFAAPRLQTYLRKLSMQERDLIWSEFLRVSYDTSAVFRLLAWVERQESSQEGAKNAMKLISLFLTTSNKPLRDRATRALVLLGRQYPSELFEETVESLTFNDAYVPERLLAAAYGVAMQLWADPEGRDLRTSIVPLARRLVTEMFLPASPNQTTHVLIREYALGIVDLARRVSPRCIATKYVRYLTGIGHLRSPFVNLSSITEKSVEDALKTMHMDFANYTLGRLMPGRRNYDDSHSEYKPIRRQIARRMIDLGYSSKAFGETDKRIAEFQSWGRADDGGKTDRYGKKYSWIAFFEMYGIRLEEGKLEERREAERVSDCDIDPSFPQRVSIWKPSLSPLFRSSPRKPERWLRKGPVPNYLALTSPDIVDDHSGPWVLLDGYINEQGSYHREVITFLRGLLINPERVAILKGQVGDSAYLGNWRIPEPADDYYTYAGEIPWSRRFGGNFRRKDGTATRHLDKAFHVYERGRWRGTSVEMPAHRWSWEGYHSTLNQVSGVLFPAPALCEALDLVNHAGTFDLFDTRGKKATQYREFKIGEGYFSSRLLYVRRDLLVKYLKLTLQKFVWVIWGERTLHYSRFEHGVDPEMQAALQEHANNFGTFVESNL